MSKVILLQGLKAFTQDVTRELVFPVAMQKEDTLPPEPRAAEVYCARLPDSKAAKKKAPYILHQFLNGKIVQPEGQLPNDTATVRSIFCVYNPNEQEGGLALLSLMDQLYLSLLERPIVGAQFVLDLKAGVESMVYPEDSAPYYAGEMITIWRMPPVRRLDATRVIHGMPPWDPNPRHSEEHVKLPGMDKYRPIPPEILINAPPAGSDAKGSESNGKENG